MKIQLFQFLKQSENTEVNMNKDMEIFYKKALKKILNFKASELSTEEFSKLKLYSEKLEVYRFVRRK